MKIYVEFQPRLGAWRAFTVDHRQQNNNSLIKYPAALMASGYTKSMAIKCLRKKIQFINKGIEVT